MSYGTDCRFSDGFSENCARVGFVRKIFIMIIFAFGLLLGHIALLHVDSVKNFLNEYYWIAFIALTVYLGTCILLACANHARSCFPWNFLLYIVLIESLAVGLMVLGSFYIMDVLLIAFACQIITLLIFVIITFMAPVDITKWTSFILLLFLQAFAFALGFIINGIVLKYPLESLAIAIGIDFVLIIKMLICFQILFNGYVFELYPHDWVLGATLMFSNTVIFLMCCLRFIGFDTDD